MPGSNLRKFKAGNIIKRMEVLRIRIGDLVVALSDYQGAIPQEYSEFLSNNGAADLAFALHVGNIPHFPVDKAVFDSGTIWSCYKSGARYIFKDRPLRNKPSRLLMSIEPGFRLADVFVRYRDWFPFSYPLDHIITIHLLSRNNGILTHACGINFKGKGILFLGGSSAGKSTLAKLWNKKYKAQILNDERIIIRKKKSSFWIFGTPWHGEVRIFSADKAPLETIFFIKHAQENQVRKLTSLEVSTRLIARSLSPYWDKSAMGQTLNSCADIAERIPAYELGFVPDERAVAFILDLL